MKNMLPILRISVPVLFLLSSPLLCQAGQEDDAKKKLQSISSEIQSLAEKDTQLGRKISSIEKQIRKSDTQLNATGKRLNKLDRTLAETTRRIAELQQKQKEAEHEKSNLRASIARYARLQQRLMMGEHASVLRQQSAADSQRMNYWLKHLNTRHQQQLARIAQKESEILELAQAQETEKKQSEKLKASLAKEMASIKKDRESQNQLARVAEKEKQKNQQTRASLENDRKRLNQLLEKLRTAQAYPDFSDNGKTPFSKLKGKLTWPAKGAISTNKFSSGVTIKTALGSKVRAISAGRVIFADWMKGYGQLVIVSHGDGYLSLYGQNESVYAEVGEQVTTGTVIAVSGQSGGQLFPGVYFEIRKNAQGLDPQQWCKGKPANE